MSSRETAAKQPRNSRETYDILRRPVAICTRTSRMMVRRWIWALPTGFLGLVCCLHHARSTSWLAKGGHLGGDDGTAPGGGRAAQSVPPENVRFSAQGQRLKSSARRPDRKRAGGRSSNETSREISVEPGSTAGLAGELPRFHFLGRPGGHVNRVN